MPMTSPIRDTRLRRFARVALLGVACLSASACSRSLWSESPSAGTEASATARTDAAATSGATGDVSKSAGSYASSSSGGGSGASVYLPDSSKSTTSGATSSGATSGGYANSSGASTTGVKDLGTTVYEPKSKPSTSFSSGATTAGARTHVVKAGENVYRISKMYGVTKEAVRAANNLDANFGIKAGQTLVIPGGGGATVSSNTGANATSGGVKLASADGGSSSGISTATSPNRMVKPVNGAISEAFKPGKNGVEITAPIGSTVVAADGGVVSYVAGPSSGVGGVVIIKHSGDILTAYGRLRNIAVRKGQTVSRGMKIAEIGRPRVGDPRLHFEIRKGATPIDPTPYL